MNYLKQRHSRVILSCFLVSSLLLWQFPAVDVRVSESFFDEGFVLSDAAWVQLIQHFIAFFLCVSTLSVLGLYVFNTSTKRGVLGVDGRKTLYLFLVLGLGAGLIVNVIFKDNFGRARPRDIVEFGGTKHFTPAFVVSRECRSNCSFTSGEGAGAFFSLALARALSRRRSILLLMFGFGCAVSFSRIAAGAHFFSDSVVSFFVMLTLADVLHYYIVLPKEARSAGSG